MSAFLFLGVILSLYLLVNGYLFARLSMTLVGAGVLRGILCGLFLLCAAAFPVARLLHGRIPDVLSGFLATVGSLYFAPMIYAFFLTLATDILRLLNGVVKLTPYPPPFSVNARFNLVMAILLLSAAICLLGAWNAKLPVVVRHEIPARSSPFAQGLVPGAIKIAAISDIHLGRLVGVAHLKKLIDLTRAEEPDIVLLVGDVMDDTDWLRDDRAREAAAALFASLAPRLGVWAVPGNHEYYAGMEACQAFFASCGIRLLRDEWAVPGDALLLIGRDDRAGARYGVERKSLPDILASARSAGAADAATRALPIVVMDHQPFELSESQEAGAALQLSGHTHRGQLFPFNFVVAGMYERHYGLYRRGDTFYYVSSGGGTWGPPVRTTGRPEVVMLTMETAKSN